MLSDKARSDANPLLLIDENDVTAGHAHQLKVDPDDGVLFDESWY